MNGHTPGPWRISAIGLMNDGSAPITSEYGQVARVSCFAEYRRGQGHAAECAMRDANAHLISAAPDMLRVLRDLMADVREGKPGRYPAAAVNAMHDAIAQAEGRS